MNAALMLVCWLIWVPVGLLLWIPLVARAAFWSIFLAVTSAIGYRSQAASTQALERALKFWASGFSLIADSFDHPPESTDYEAQFNRIPWADAATVGLWALIFWIGVSAPFTLTPELIKTLRGSAESSKDEILPTPPTTSHTLIQPKTFEVKAGKYWHTPISIPSENCKVEGTLEGIAGGKREIQVMISTEDQFSAYSNDADNVVMTFKSNKFDHGSLSIPLSRGSYHFIVSNTFSTWTDKWVTLGEIVARCPAP